MLQQNNLNPTETELIKSYLIPRLAPYLLVLFGSAAHGRLRRESDIDLAFLSDQPHGAYDIFMIAQGLADKLGREVDLVDLAKASTVFKAQVFRTGEVLIDGDPVRRMRYYMMAFKEYVMLNEERQEILKRYGSLGVEGMTDDVVLNKVETIRRCLQRIEEVYEGDPENLNDYTKQDSIILNIQRACEASIDLAMHLIAEASLGLPQSSREAFDLLEKHGIISNQLSKRLKAMVGFRNIAVHDYQAIKIEIIRKIIEYHLLDFIDFVDKVLKR